MSWLNLGSFAGLVALAFLAWAAGGFRRPVPWRPVLASGGLMLVLGAVVFWAPWTRTVLIWINDTVIALLAAGNEGARFLFGPLALSPGQATAGGAPSVGFVLAAQVFPAVIFFAALMAALYHLGVLQLVVKAFAALFHRTLGLSGAEALAGSSNIFIGVESAMTVRPFLDRMTRSELLTLMTCGMSTVASTTLALYVLFLKDGFPLIAGHLVSASVMSIPAAVLASKLILPESQVPETRGSVPPASDERRKQNTMAALMDGSWEGLKLAAGIATLLIAVLGVVALVDYALVRATAPLGDALGGPVHLRRALGWLFTPMAWLLGLDGPDTAAAGRLLGERVILTEVVAYQDLGKLAGTVSPRTLLVLSYALCGFAHVASVGIFVGGIAALAPGRRGELSSLGLPALAGATLATLMTGALAGLYYHGQPGLIGT